MKVDYETAQKALETEFVCYALGEPPITIRNYFHALLTKLWEEEDSFSGKRPFGNSGWQYDLVFPLVKGGFVPGHRDELETECEVYEVDDFNQYTAFVADLISHALSGPKEQDRGE